jgi:hypothetical protein
MAQVIEEKIDVNETHYIQRKANLAGMWALCEKATDLVLDACISRHDLLERNCIKITALYPQGDQKQVTTDTTLIEKGQNMFNAEEIATTIKGITSLVGNDSSAYILEYHAAAVIHGLLEHTPSILFSSDEKGLKAYQTTFAHAAFVLNGNYFRSSYAVNHQLQMLVPAYTDNDTVIIGGLRVLTLANLLAQFQELQQKSGITPAHTGIIPAITERLSNMAVSSIDLDSVKERLSHIGITVANTLVPLINKTELTSILKGYAIRVCDQQDRVWHVHQTDGSPLYFSRLANVRRSSLTSVEQEQIQVSPLAFKHAKTDLSFAITIL